MAEEAEAVDRYGELLDLLEPMAKHLERIDTMLTEFEPIIRKLMAPDASGPLAWAIRKRTEDT